MTKKKTNIDSYCRTAMRNVIGGFSEPTRTALPNVVTRKQSKRRGEKSPHNVGLKANNKERNGGMEIEIAGKPAEV